MSMGATWTTVLLAASLLCGCTAVGKDLAKGAADEIQPRVRQIASDAAGGARDTLLSDETKRRMLELEQAMVHGAGDAIGDEHSVAAVRKLETALIDQLRADLLKTEGAMLGERLERRLAALREEILGARTRADVVAMRDALLGPGLRDLVHQAVQDALGDSTRARVAVLRDEVVGQPLRTAVKALIVQASSDFADEWVHKVQPALESSAVNARNKIITVLAIAIGGVAGLLAYAHYLRGQYRNISGLLATKIEQLAAQPGGRDLKRQIQAEAIDKGLERRLRRLLYEKGLNKTP